MEHKATIINSDTKIIFIRRILLFIKVRSTGKLIESKINLQNNKAVVNLSETEQGVSPGQACVFYEKNNLGDKVLGGGWIDKTEKKYLST